MRRCETLLRILRNATLINADATSLRILREEQVGGADFFVAATSNDEDNVMTCLQARDLGVARCLTLIHRADYADILIRSGDRLGIFGAVSPRLATLRDLGRFASRETLHPLLTLDADIQIVEFTLPPAGLLTGRRVQDVSWPAGTGLMAVSRGSSVFVPAASDQLQAGDCVIALVGERGRRELARLAA